MTPIEELNKRFKYTPDKLDKWTIMTNSSGPLKGDCEDYSLTLIWLSEGKSFVNFVFALLFMKYVLWYCYYNGEPHMIVKSKGMFADNIQRKWTKPFPKQYKMRFPVPSIFALIFYAIKRF